MKHPTQPLEADAHGVVRFTSNLIVRKLLDKASAGERWDLNDIHLEVATGKLPVEDYMQLHQLIGYSASGYGDAAYSQEETQWRRHAGQMDAKAVRVYEAWRAAQ